MSGSFRNWLASGFILSVSLAGFAETALPGKVESSLKITVRVYNYAQVSEQTLTLAKREATSIFSKAAVDLVWLDHPLSTGKTIGNLAGRFGFDPTQLQLKILSRSMAKHLDHKDSTAGLAFTGSGGQVSCVANVFDHRIERMAKSRVASLPQVLDHAMAHEIGHLLLRSLTHSLTGLMRGRWDPKDLLQAAPGRSAFHAAAIRTHTK